MKNLGKILLACAVVCAGVFSCQKTIDQDTNDREASLRSLEECAGPYTVTLVSKQLTAPGEWTWTWSIVNPNPGNGEDGTVQGLSHMSFVFPVCIPAEQLLSAAYKKDGGDWVEVSTIPVVDPSIVNTCDPTYDTEAIKFDLDGNGQIRMVLNTNYQIGGVMTGIYKSGSNTGCGEFCFEGIACLPENPFEDDCSMSQGFWFAKPLSEVNAWPGGGVTMGGHFYTAAEARSLFWVTGNIELKRAFCQAATIKLSDAAGFIEGTPTVLNAVSSIDGVLSGLPKLTPANIVATNKSLSPTVRKNLGMWAGSIGNWVDENHCELNTTY